MTSCATQKTDGNAHCALAATATVITVVPMVATTVHGTLGVDGSFWPLSSSAPSCSFSSSRK